MAPELGRGTGSYSPDDIRQFRGELREWQSDAQALRQRLTQAGIDPRELDADHASSFGSSTTIRCSPIRGTSRPFKRTCWRS